MARPMTAEQAWHAATAVVPDAWLVGGSVRDTLMQRECEDFDFVTPLSADEIESAIRAAGRRPYLLGKRFGTIGFTIEGRKVEVTTLRDADLIGDLGHRDFTINAMAMRPGELTDPHGGQADIAARLVRATGDALERMREDPLRILRAARFAAQLGFDVEPGTCDAMARYAHRLLGVAHERQATELDRLFVAPGAVPALRLLAQTGVLRWVLPELSLQVGFDQNSPYHDRNLFEHTLGVLEATPVDDLDMRWAALLHDIGKPYTRAEKPGRSTYLKHELLGAEIVERIATSLKWSTARRVRVRELVSGHMHPESPLCAADDSAKSPERPGATSG